MRNPLLLNRNETALLIIDIQERLLPAMADPDGVITNTGKLISACHILNVPIILTEQYPKGLGPTDSRLISLLGGGYSPFEKTTFSCCGDNAVNSAIKSVAAKQILLCGIETHVCVLQTALDFFQNGFKVHVAADAVSSRTGDNKTIALHRMAASGITVTCTESAIFELLERAGTPRFKEVSAIIK